VDAGRSLSRVLAGHSTDERSDLRIDRATSASVSALPGSIEAVSGAPQQGLSEWSPWAKRATGLVCPPLDPDTMARTIERLWDDDALATQLTRNARALATEECSEQRTVGYFKEYARGLGLL